MFWIGIIVVLVTCALPSGSETFLNYIDNGLTVLLKGADMVYPNIFPPDVREEMFMEPTSLIAKYGYQAENHTVKTSDNYLLTLHRVPNFKQDAIPVLLMHGAAFASSQFFINQERSSAFQLYNAGYDVWMGNFRGTKFTKHMNYTRDDKEYWFFNYDQMSLLDLPPTIDYILEHTNNKKLLYVGHSIGTTLGFTLFSSSKEYREKIAGFIAMAPVITLTYSPAPLVQFRGLLFHLLNLLEELGCYHVTNLSPSETLWSEILSCSNKDNYDQCEISMSLFGGFDPYLHNQTRLPIIMSHGVHGISTDLIKETIKSYKVGIHMFDYGQDENLRRYGTASPPGVDVGKMTIPTVLFHAANDLMANPLDYALLKRRLPLVVASELLPFPMSNHLDFTAAIDADRIVFDKVIRYGKELWEKNSGL